MKLRSAPLDDVHQEAQFVLESAGGPLAQVALRFANSIYRCHRSVLLVILRRRWSVSPEVN